MAVPHNRLHGLQRPKNAEKSGAQRRERPRRARRRPLSPHCAGLVVRLEAGAVAFFQSYIIRRGIGKRRGAFATWSGTLRSSVGQKADDREKSTLRYICPAAASARGGPPAERSSRPKIELAEPTSVRATTSSCLWRARAPIADHEPPRPERPRGQNGNRGRPPGRRARGGGGAGGGGWCKYHVHVPSSPSSIFLLLHHIHI